jgi:hypothetical protein
MPDETPAPAQLKPIQTVFETVTLEAAQIDELNAKYAALGLSLVVIDVRQFQAKLELQADGSYKRTLIRRPRAKR